jgi:hypothetical protein
LFPARLSFFLVQDAILCYNELGRFFLDFNGLKAKIKPGFLVKGENDPGRFGIDERGI